MPNFVTICFRHFLPDLTSYIHYSITCYEYFGFLSTVLPLVLADAVGVGDSDVELLHTLHKGPEQEAPVYEQSMENIQILLGFCCN